MLLEDRDYVLVNESTYDLLQKLYSGGPKIFLEEIDSKKINLEPLIGLYNEDNYSYINSTF